MRPQLPIRYRFVLAFGAAMAFAHLQPAAAASSPCPLIRPPGLDAKNVDDVVVASFAQALHLSPDKIDVRLTPRVLDGSDTVVVSYFLAVQNISYSLGFNAIPVYRDAAKAKGSDKPFEALTLAQLQEIARKAYAAGIDSPPPNVTEETTYQLSRGVEVSTPRPATGWALLQCAPDRAAFQKKSLQRGRTTTETIHLAMLPAWQDELTFTREVRKMLAALNQTAAASATVDIVRGTLNPCADFHAAAATAAMPYDVYGRACYRSGTKTSALITLVEFAGGAPTDDELAQARDFIGEASPK
jgi:hypothetical protein